MAGSAVTALLAFVLHKLHGKRLTARLSAEADGRLKALSAEQADHGAAIREREQAAQEMEALAAQLSEELRQQSASVEELRATLKAAADDKDQWAHQAQLIANEAARLKSL